MASQHQTPGGDCQDSESRRSRLGAWLSLKPSCQPRKIDSYRRVMPGGGVVGIDIQPGMIQWPKVHAAQAGVSNLTAILGDATQPHFPSESFDVVFLCTVLGEIPDREALLRQCYAVLKPGGLLSITEVFPDPHYQSRATVRRLAEATSFRLREMHSRWHFFTANFVKANDTQGVMK